MTSTELRAKQQQHRWQHITHKLKNKLQKCEWILAKLALLISWQIQNGSLDFDFFHYSWGKTIHFSWNPLKPKPLTLLPLMFWSLARVATTSLGFTKCRKNNRIDILNRRRFWWCPEEDEQPATTEWIRSTAASECCELDVTNGRRQARIYVPEQEEEKKRCKKPLIRVEMHQASRPLPLFYWLSKTQRDSCNVLKLSVGM